MAVPRVPLVGVFVDAAEMLVKLSKIAICRVRIALHGPSASGDCSGAGSQIRLLDFDGRGFDEHKAGRRLLEQPTMSGALMIALVGFGRETDRPASSMLTLTDTC